VLRRLEGRQSRGEEGADAGNVSEVVRNGCGVQVSRPDRPQGDGTVLAFDPVPMAEQSPAGADAVPVGVAAVREANGQVLGLRLRSAQGHDGAAGNEAAEGEGEKGAGALAPSPSAGLRPIEDAVGGGGIQGVPQVAEGEGRSGHGRAGAVRRG
jgi:hypothetical protein